MEVQNDVSKILSQMLKGVSSTAAKKFDAKKKQNINETFEFSCTKKFKFSMEPNNETQSITGNKITAKENLNTSTKSESAALELSIENKKMKPDLLEAKSKIIKLKSEIEQQYKNHNKMEILSNSQITELKKQCEFSSNKCIEMERNMKLMKKREATTRQELIKVKNESDLVKKTYDDKIYKLQRTKTELEENLRHYQNRFTNEMNEYKRNEEKLKLDINLANDELKIIRKQLSELQSKSFNFDELKSELEQKTQEIELKNSKIKELEYEISSYSDWKEISKTMEKRLVSIQDLEKEITRLRKENKNIRDSIGNKLLLEEQVHDLTTRLARYENEAADTAALKTQISSLERELKNWKEIGEDHCLPHCPVNPSTLRSRIEQILQRDLILTSEKGNSKSEKKSYQLRAEELKSQNDQLTKSNMSLKTSLKQREAIMMRTKKKLLMIGKERDCYKQLVENFEKDMTISGALIDTLNPDIQLRTRCDILEKNIATYKELCNHLQKELGSVKQYSDLGILEPLIAVNESYEHIRKEIEDLRFENDRLRRRKDELELEMEHKCLKDNFKIDTFEKDQNIKETEEHVKKLEVEIKNLKEQNEKLKEDLKESEKNTKESEDRENKLRKQLELKETKIEELKDFHKSRNIELREVCYMLFGYRIQRISDLTYRISSMFAENEDEYLDFRLNESCEILDMLETEYSNSINEMVNKHLTENNSLPILLCRLTLQLFNRRTIL